MYVYDTIMDAYTSICIKKIKMHVSSSSVMKKASLKNNLIRLFKEMFFLLRYSFLSIFKERSSILKFMSFTLFPRLAL